MGNQQWLKASVRRGWADDCLASKESVVEDALWLASCKCISDYKWGKFVGSYCDKKGSCPTAFEPPKLGAFYEEKDLGIYQLCNEVEEILREGTRYRSLENDVHRAVKSKQLVRSLFLMLDNAEAEVRSDEGEALKRLRSTRNDKVRVGSVKTQIAGPDNVTHLKMKKIYRFYSAANEEIEICIEKRATAAGAIRRRGVYSLGTYVPKIAANCWVAPNAAVVGNVIMQEQSSVWFGATVRGDNAEPITIGERTNVQDGAVLHADAGIPLTIGSGVTIGHQAMLHGCTVGENSLIGIGATVLNKSVIGSNCVVGAHCLIPENKTIPDGSLVVGSPGKVVRQLSEEQIEALKQGAEHYVKNQEWFNEALELVDDKNEPQSKL
ncbi:hypothetical protein ACHAXT_002871 [Thalassiosira profunda]